MKKLIGIGAGVGAFLGVCAFVQTGASDLLSKHCKALSEADGLTVTYSVQRIGGAPVETTMTLARPNKARIEDSSRVVIADGTTMTFFDKKTNSYFKRAQTAQELAALIGAEGASTWAAFFNKDQFAKAGSAKAAGTKNRKGKTFQVVKIVPSDKAGTWTLYLDPADGIARQAEIELGTGADATIVLVDAKSLSLSAASTADVFAFKAPDGSKEISEAELYADRWYYDLDEAKDVAVKTNRMVFLDFYTDW